jgi:hypothetical protein
MYRKRTPSDPSEKLVDIRSATFGAVSSLLSSLETHENIMLKDIHTFTSSLPVV